LFGIPPLKAQNDYILKKFGGYGPRGPMPTVWRKPIS